MLFWVERSCWQNVASGGVSIGHKSSIFASKVMATTVIDLLIDPDAVNKAKEEWKRRTKGIAYKSPLPKNLKPPLDQLPARLRTNHPMSQKGAKPVVDENAR